MKIIQIQPVDAFQISTHRHLPTAGALKGPLWPESVSNQKKGGRGQYGMTPTFQKKKKKDQK